VLAYDCACGIKGFLHRVIVGLTLDIPAQNVDDLQGNCDPIEDGIILIESTNREASAFSQ